MRIAIAEDGGLVRAGIEMLLTRAGVEVIHSVADGSSLLEAVRSDAPDAVLLDMRIPPSDHEGLHLAADLRTDLPELGILIMTAEPSAEDAIELFSLLGSKSVGYCSKDALRDVDHLIDCLERVAGGGCAVDRIVPKQILRRSSRRELLASLTGAEQEVMEYMAMGLTNAGIASISGRSAGTVSGHVKAIYVKLGLNESNDSSVDRRTMVVLAALGGRSARES